MIGARHVQQRRASDAMFFRQADCQLDLRRLTGNHDLSRRIDVGNIDIRISRQRAHRSLIRANHRGHRARRGRTRRIHQAPTRLDQFQTSGEIERSRRGMRRPFT
jgi:hypothetical protein